MNSSNEIQLYTIVWPATGLVAADLNGEKVMLNIDKGKYYGLDGIGSRIWELIEEPHTVQEVVNTLLKEYDVDKKTCQEDVLRYINNLHTQGLVEIA